MMFRPSKSNRNNSSVLSVNLDGANTDITSAYIDNNLIGIKDEESSSSNQGFTVKNSTENIHPENAADSDL